MQNKIFLGILGFIMMIVYFITIVVGLRGIGEAIANNFNVPIPVGIVIWTGFYLFVNIATIILLVETRER